MRKLFTLFVTLLATTCLWAQRFQVGDLYFNITSSSEPYTVEVTYQYFNSSSNYYKLTTVTIPETVTYGSTIHRVTSIGDHAFDGCYKLTSVTIPESVTSIGNCAFDGCYKLTSVTIPNSVTTIGYQAFYNCSSLTSVTIPNSVTSIGSTAFRGCSSLISITIPNSMTNIGDRVFSDCSSLTSIIIPESVTSIGWEAFKNCASLTSISIPSCIASIGKDAFEGTLWYNNCPDGLVYIGNVLYTYKGTMPANSTIEIKDGTISISSAAFDNCSSLISITIPESVTSIGAEAFGSCSSLTSITIPNSVTSIENYTFYNCSSLTSVTIGNSVTSIGWYAFENCSSLASITIPNGVTSIGERSFYDCSSLATINIPNSVTIISYNAFAGTSWYENQPNGMIYAGKVLYDYKGTMPTNTTIEIMDGTVSISAYAFSSCYSLTSITIPNSVTSIGDYAFRKCTNVKEITIGEGVIDLGNYAFSEIDCPYLYLYALTPPSISHTFGEHRFEKLIVNKNSVEIYKNQWSGVAKQIIAFGDIFIGEVTQEVNCTSASLMLPIHNYDNTEKYNIGYIWNNDTSYVELNDTLKLNLTNLSVNTQYSISFFAAKINEPIEGESIKIVNFQTKDIDVYIYTKSKTQTTLHIGLRYNAGDATITDKGLIVHCPNGKIDTISIKNTYEGMTGDTLLTQLRINSEYDVYGFILTEEGGLKVGNGNAIYTNNIESTITSSNRTQTTIPLSASLGLGDATDYNKNGLQWTIGSSFNSNNYETIYFKKGEFNLDTTLTHLSPNTQYAFRLFHYSVDETGKEYCVYGDTRKFTTSSVVLYEPKLQTTGQTYIEVQTSSAYGDATLLEEVVEVATSKYNTPEQRVNVAGRSNVIINNLMPDTKYYFRSVLTTQEAGTMESEWYEATTEEITLATGDADGISNSSAFLHGTIDCDTMSRTEIGFEWKRSDAPSTVKPQRLLVVDRVDENLIFRLEGLSSDRYYDFRTFCLYNGKEYYGEWVGFLTSDKDILIPPSVQTREAEITDLGVLMKGFVVAGTEVILQRGFECWREESDQVATTVAEGAIMSSYIPEAWSYTTYKYRAYAKTPAGTTYGETLEVTTEYIATNIADIIVNASSNSAQVTWTMVEQADYYILTLYSDESMTEVIGIYTVDKNGNVTQKRVASATQSLVTCELTELLPETNYYFAVKAYNSDDQKVAEENGSFATTVVPTYVENTHTQSPMTDCQKIIRNGQLLILRDGKTYTVMGAEVK